MFDKLAEIGWRNVEFAGFEKTDSRTVARALASSGLSAVGAHVPIEQLRPELISKTLDDHLTIGNHTLVCPWLKPAADTPNLSDWWKERADELSRAAETAKAVGMHVGYHNHRHEITDVVGGWMPLDILFSRFSKDVFMQMDVGHLLFVGGDPESFLSRYPDRLVSLHLTRWHLLDDRRLRSLAASSKVFKGFVVEHAENRDTFDNAMRGLVRFKDLIV